MNYTQYNGWTNYATWRASLELFEVLDPLPERGTARWSSAQDLAVQLEEFAINFVNELYDDADANPAGRAIVAGWARAFLADVNWQEIAGHMIDAHRKEKA